MTALGWILVLAGLVTGFVVGWMRGKQLLANAVSRPAYDKLLEERTVFATQLEAATDELKQTKSRQTEFHERALKAEANQQALEKQLKEQQAQLRAEFSNTANKLFEDMSKKFSTQSEEKLGTILNPLRERLGEFQKLVGESFTVQRTEQNTLKNEIEKIVLQADSLTKALRGDVKAQGNWGEVMLERVLEESGLQKGIDYVIQGSDMGLSGADGNRLRPDVIVNLPDKKHIIIDAKVSLVAYERYCAEADETARAVHLKEFLKSIKAHVGGLAEKRYQDIDKLGTPDFVLMFMPIEGAYSLAVQQDRELHSYAWEKKVAMVCPSTLFVTLQTVASLWRIERQSRNAQEIAVQGGRLYDKFAGFLKDLQAVGAQLGRTQKSYDDAMNKLSEGRGNIVDGVEKLKQLGAKTTKSLPMEFGGDESADDDVVQDMPKIAGQ